MAKPEYKETITVRKGLDFGLSGDDIPTYWMEGDPYKTRMMDAVQATFPDGERYFISSVRAFREQVTEPEMKQDIKDFMQQEGQHGMVHKRFNERLQRQGLQIGRITEFTKALCNRRLQHYSAEYNVALTAALEHFTAMMAELFFAEKQILQGADERVRAMMAWHAVEEMEHKAVAFDVMQKIAKVGYAKRVLAMTHATLSFMLFMLITPWHMLAMDGFSRRQRLGLYARQLGWMFSPRRGLMMRLLPMLAQYYKPGFHPNHVQTVHNYQAWKSSYERTGDAVAAAQTMHAAAY